MTPKQPGSPTPDPDQQLRILVKISAPPRRPVRLAFISRGQDVIPAFDRGASSALAPASLTSLAGALFDLLKTDPSRLPLPTLLLRPPAYRLCSLLWGAAGAAFSEPLVLEEAVATLASAGITAFEARELLLELSRIGFCDVQNNRIALSAPAREWMEVLASGHLVKVETLPVPHNRGALSVADRARSLSFVGPPGRRALCLELTADELDGRAGRGAGPESSSPTRPRILVLTTLPPEVLRSAIRDLVGLPAVREKPVLPAGARLESRETRRAGRLRKRDRASFKS